MKNILLVNTNTEKVPYPVPPLGLCFLETILKSKYNVKIYDAMFDNSLNFTKIIEDFKPDYIGLSIRNIDDMRIINNTYYIPELIEKFIKPLSKYKEIPVILGGSGFSIFPEELMKITEADYGIIGEGEESFPALLEALENGLSIENIPGVITKELKINNLIKFYNFRDSKFSEIDKKIDFLPYKERGVYSIQTKRGCYHKCIYCTYPAIEGNKFRTRDPEDIANEIEEASKRLGYFTFEFVDSTFNDPEFHAESICEEIIKKNLKIKLRTMGINPANCSENLIKLMKKAGFSQIDCTPDSASEKMINNLKKNFSIDSLINTANLIKKYNLPTMWFFIFGGPGETEQTVKETLKFIENYVNPLDIAHLTVGLRIYPETELYNISVNEGIINKDQSILEPIFYISNEIGYQKLTQLITIAGKTKINCIPGFESNPPKAMVDKAIQYRKENNIDEPMFRTFQRFRAEFM